MRLTVSRRWAIFLTATALFVLSQFYRAAIAVITPQLIADLGVDTRDLSLMSAAFFYAFALTQVPIAVYLDPIGARRAMTALNVVGIGGALLFAAARSTEALVVARLLLGIGMACNLMGTLKLVATWFSPLRFATLAAVVFSMGTAGNILATTPLVLVVQAAGWRFAFLLVAALNLVLTVVFALVVKDAPPSATPTAPATPQSLYSAVKDIGQLFRIRDYWVISVGTFCRYGIYAAVQSLYAGPYLMNALQFSPIQAGNVIFGMNLGFILGGPLFGTLSDRLLRTRKWIVIPGLAGIALIFVLLAHLPTDAAVGTVAVLFFLLGIGNSSSGIMYTHIKERMPLAKAGMAVTGVNFFTMVGSAVFLQGLGYYMQSRFPQDTLSPAAFEGAFTICSVCIAAVAVLYLSTTDSRGGGQ